MSSSSGGDLAIYALQKTSEVMTAANYSDVDVLVFQRLAM